ncbi:class I SAM-dependent methyltransferase [Pantoea ananatis]|uniref:class I SAM-dependent methyltransferase n=1 Tax=Pantoea ananas TaxID=553 RepID=UPI000CF5745C|nr:class I SAM-dependent methyltransferase [Pantoea ananatis]PQK76482.1 hypothetical protein CG427_06965 [Pantoea ananatis]
MYSDHEQYAEEWQKESQVMHSKGIYSALASMTPEGNVLEFGCGAGHSSLSLLEKHDVLSLDNNQHLIEIALKYLNENDYSAKILQCDFYNLTDADKQLIRNFNPKVIIGWLIGGSGTDQLKRVPHQQYDPEVSKKYRENIEDIIVATAKCIETVEYIQLANRGYGVANADKNDEFLGIKADYDQYVFNEAGFEVISVETMAWKCEESEFNYAHAHNPNFANGNEVDVVTVVTSILAKRIR